MRVRASAAARACARRMALSRRACTREDHPSDVSVVDGETGVPGTVAVGAARSASADGRKSRMQWSNCKATSS